ncbi:50S ribosomal protein L24 [candidate division WWE3 bacterium]|nr:50S ribosomal protein L24 [candidate division WWE3 bacterium]
MNIRINDTVQIITGKQRGSKGVVEKIIPQEGRIVVGGLNLVKKHRKAQGNRPAGRIEMSAPIDASNVMVVCPHCSMKTRIGYRVEGENKVRFCKQCKKEIK